MSGQPTRAGLSPETDNTIRARLPAEWRGFGAFLRRPVLPDRAELSLKRSARALPAMLALDMLLMAAVLGAIGIAAALGLKMPEHTLNGIELTAVLVAFIVLGAPIGEEVLFRAWLSGRPGHVLASFLVFCAIATIVVNANGAAAIDETASAPLAFGVLGCLASAFFAVLTLRKRGAMPWFQRHFRWFYYASALGFAAMHLSNFAGTGGPSAAQLPLVLPQLVLGLILGYLRVNRGLATGIALHILHNALFASLMLTGAS